MAIQDELHEQVLTRAAEMANADPRLADIQNEVMGLHFYEANNRTSDAFLTLEYTAQVVDLIEDEKRREEVRKILRQIGMDATRNAFVEVGQEYSGDVIVRLIVGYAQKGINYFERYEKRD